MVLSRSDRRAPRSDGPVLTTVVFQVRNIPAALYKALGGFATNGVNMTKLESYMLEGTFTSRTGLSTSVGRVGASRPSVSKKPCNAIAFIHAVSRFCMYSVSALNKARSESKTWG